MSALSPKQRMLTELAASLQALADRMDAQQTRASESFDLACRADEIAREARRLAYSRGIAQEEEERALCAELENFCRDMKQVVEQVTKDSLLGKAVAEALVKHAADIDSLAGMADGVEDMAQIRARLRPLAVTLAEVPARQKADASRMNEFAELAQRADKAAQLAAVLAHTDSVRDRQTQMVALSRDIADLAKDTVGVSRRYAEDAALAVEAAAGMANRAKSIASGTPGTSLDDRRSITRLVAAGHSLLQGGDTAPPPARAAVAAQGIRWR